MAKRLKLLLAAPNWLGDLVMATSLFDLFAIGESQYGIPRPDLQVSVRRRWRPLLAGDTRLAGLVDYERTGRHAGLPGIYRQATAWRDVSPSAVMVLPPSLRAGAVARLSGIRTRIGFRGEGRDPLLSHAVARPQRGIQHYAEELQRLYRVWTEVCLGVTAPEILPAPVPRLLIDPDTAARRDADTGPPVWVVAVGSTYGDAKTWPPERVASFIDRVSDRESVRIVLIGDAGAREVADTVRAATCGQWSVTLDQNAGLVDLVGRTSLVELAGLLAAAAVFVGNDSGSMHLAAALGTPTVGIYGSSSTAWTRPLGARTTTVSTEGFACQPCFLKTCPEETFCLDTLTAERVHAAALALLDVPGAGPIRYKVPPQPLGETAPVLFVDRDGVIIEDTDYISDPAAVVLIPGAAEALARARKAGMRLVAVTNQSGIGRGYYSDRDFAAVQSRVDALLADAGVTLDAVYYCPHAPEAACNCRKPRPGLLDAAAASFSWTSETAWMIGDKLSDIRLGRQAGLQSYLVRTGQGNRAVHDLTPDPRVDVVADLSAAVNDILGEG
jgi:heptosyltransferase II